MAKAVCPAWEIAQVVAERLNVDPHVSQNVVRLLEEENTIPFIARYRREQTGMMDVDKLREVHLLLEELRSVQTKMKSVASTIEKAGKLTEDLKSLLETSQSVAEIEHVYAPFKTGSKKRLSERAKELGLEPLAMRVFNRPEAVDINGAVNPKVKGLKTAKDVETGVQQILADVIAKDRDVMNLVRDLCIRFSGNLETVQSTTKVKKEGNKDAKEKPAKADKSYKYEQYFSFHCSLRYLRPHQVMAINRAESEKFISVKVTYPDHVKVKYCQFCERRWWRRNSKPEVQRIVKNSIEDAYTRLIMPLMCRRARADLTKEATKASVDVFASNLKRLLLQPPLRGKVVCGLDPGFRNGCKLAVTSATGQILHTDVLYIMGSEGNLRREREKLRTAVLKHRCDSIAIGNGTACRETETFVSDMIKQDAFSPLNVMYCIVNENGASIYSVSDEAKKEMPSLDVNLRSAVSIARRLQDPLAELVKIEPKHIGVGMYQHDVADSLLQKSLDSVVEECVSFVGVDVNTGSECLLRRVAGLNSARAKNIVQWRETNGPFINRAQLQSVKGIGPKSYVQCAGFVRILHQKENSCDNRCSEVKTEPLESKTDSKGTKRKATTTKGKSKKAKLNMDFEPNPLDRSCIHPESYDLTNRVLREAKLSADEIGERHFIKQMKQWLQSTGVEKLAAKMAVGVPTMQLIMDGLTQPIEHDIRAAFEKPLFKKGMTSISDLKLGNKLSGGVVNVTHFGAFVDIGVGKDALIHTSNMPASALGGKKSLELGDRVEVEVCKLDMSRKNIGLRLMALL